MSAEPSAGGDGFANPGGTGRRMAQGNDDVSLHQPFNKFEGTLKLRGQGDESDSTAGSFLPALKLIPIRPANMLERMRAPGSVFRGNVRSLQMNGRNGTSQFRIGFAVPPDRGQAVSDSRTRIHPMLPTQ